MAITEDLDDPGSGLVALVYDSDWQDLATSAGGVGRFVVDLADGVCEIDATLRRLTGQLELISTFPLARFIAGIHSEDRAAVEAAIAATAEGAATYSMEFRYRRAGGEEIWLAGEGRRMATASGRELLIGVNYDITELRRARETADLLSGEMAHRMKNVFALVQGMFNMAARSATDVESLADGFSGRLRALSEVNALTFAGADRTVGLAQLVDAVLGPLIAEGRVRPVVDAGYRLNGAAAQTLVLTMNELMTNAVKHGALRADGHIDLAATVVDGDFVFDWTESGGAPVPAPEGPSGFGMRVLQSMTASTHRGRPVFDWRPEGMRFRCTWDADAFGEGTEAPFHEL